MLRVSGDELLGFLDAADGDTDGVTIGRLEMLFLLVWGVEIAHPCARRMSRM